MKVCHGLAVYGAGHGDALTLVFDVGVGKSESGVLYVDDGLTQPLP